VEKSKPANWLGIKETPRPAEDGDFFPTHPGITLALLQHELFPGTVWEPACGQGDISRVLEEQGYQVHSTDLFHRGYGLSRFDFFGFSEMPICCESLITNPPFKTVDRLGNKRTTTDWINHIGFLSDNWKMCKLQKAALLLKTTAVAGKKRSVALKRAGFCRLLQFRGRLQFEKEKLPGDNGPQGMMEFAWFIFERGFQGEPSIRWIDEINPNQPCLPWGDDDDDT